MMRYIGQRGTAAYPEGKFLDCVRGGMARRRREAAIAVQLTTRWRSRQMAMSCAIVFYDQANAFGSIPLESMDDVDFRRCDADDASQ
eukprot:4355997-Pyramimonas_sp.AAC.1